MKSFKLIGLALGASFALSASAFAQDTTIAVAGPMTGGESAFGRQMKNGAEMAVADLNAAGGLLGKKLALDVEDDACDPKQARSVAEKIGSAKIPFVAGHYCSSSSIPASEAYADGNTLQITPASTNPLFTERKLWNVARVCGRDDQHGEAVLPVQGADGIENLPRDQRREPERGFVQHQQARSAHQRAPDRQHLLFSAGQCAAALGHAFLQPREQREDAFKSSGTLGLAAIGRVRAHLQVFRHAHAWENPAAFG